MKNPKSVEKLRPIYFYLPCQKLLDITMSLWINETNRLTYNQDLGSITVCILCTALSNFFSDKIVLRQWHIHLPFSTWLSINSWDKMSYYRFSQTSVGWVGSISQSEIYMWAEEVSLISDQWWQWAP